MDEIMGEMSLEDKPGTSSGNVVLSAEIKKKYSWDINREMYHRELNLTNRIGWRGAHTSAEGFNQAFYGSRQAVEQLTELFRHDKRGTCLNFNRVGDLLCSGCHVGEIVVWDWVNQKRLHRHIPGPYGRIKGIKFLDSTAGLDIVCASEGNQVHRSVIPPSGGAVKSELLYTHDNVAQLIVVPHSRYEVLTCGSHLKHFDIRTHVSTTLLRCTNETEERHLPIFSIAHHPYAPEISIAGSDDVLRVYDKRNTSIFLAQKSPFRAGDVPFTWISSVAYNHSGSEILVGYSHADIYLFNSRDLNADYLHRYQGRWNHSAGTAQFFGPKSEFVMSANYGVYIMFWDRNTEEMIKKTISKPISWIHALEPHPWMPVLASAEAEHAIKIWAPQGGTDNGLAPVPKPSLI